jgi:hypothetical protein
VTDEPPYVDFDVDGDPGAVDEDLPEPTGAPWRLRARVPLGVAAAVVLLAALLFRVTSGGPDRRSPAAAPDTTRSTVVPSTGAGPTFSIRIPRILPRHGGIVIRIPVAGASGLGCNVLPECIMSADAPDSVLAALHDLVPGAHVAFSRTTIERTGIAGRHHRFESTTVIAHRGKATVRISVTRTTKPPSRPTQAGERETAFGAEVFARAYRDGYLVSIEITAPTGRAPAHVADVLKLAKDARLRPAD